MPNAKAASRRSTEFMKWYRKLPFRLPLFNAMVYFILDLHVAWTKHKVKRFAKTRQAEIDDWYKKTNIFFGFAIIRSGTTFLANFLNASAKDSIVMHEAILSDYWAYPKAFDSDEKAYDYLSKFRRDEIYYRVGGKGIKTYGEINPFLRRHAKVIKQVFPEAKLFHLARDGRDVVRSIMSRATLDKKDPWYKHIYPKPGTKFYEEWDKMNRFQKVCWLWQEDNRYLRETIGYTINFENLISDYSYFKEKLLDYVGLEVSYEDWRSFVNRPKNQTAEFKLSHWSQWSEQEKDDFRRICGDEMSANGYTLPEV